MHSPVQAKEKIYKKGQLYQVWCPDPQDKNKMPLDT